MNGTAPTVIPKSVPPPTKARKDLVRSVYRSTNGEGTRSRWRILTAMRAAETSPKVVIDIQPEPGSEAR